MDFGKSDWRVIVIKSIIGYAQNAVTGVRFIYPPGHAGNVE